MAGVAEKARFYVERAVPQLREWEEKEIFTKDEIRSIVQKRNDHEHKVLSPGVTPTEWSTYAKWEQSLEALRAKRCLRLKIRHLNSAHAGQGRVLSIYERSVTRHPGSSFLWREYLTYAAAVKASKRWRRIMTNALRMMPNDAGLWVMAGRKAARNGDMAAARGFFMRGCRFCTRDAALWVEYARCEMEWLERVERRKKAGGDALRPDKTNEEDEIRLVASDDDEEDEDGTLLPEPTTVQAKIIDKKATQELTSNPAMDGAIPMAVFDISRKQPFFKPSVAEQFFDMFAAFRALAVQPRIVQHVLDVLDADYANTAVASSCHVRRPIAGLSPNTAEFARGLRDVLASLKVQLEVTTQREELERKTVAWIDEYLAMEGLDEGIKTVLEHTKGKLEAS